MSDQKKRPRTFWNATIKDQIGLPKELANVVIDKDLKSLKQFESDCKNNREPEPPKCHLKPMVMDGNELETWWECSHCGHTKLAWTESYPY